VGAGEAANDLDVAGTGLALTQEAQTQAIVLRPGHGAAQSPKPSAKASSLSDLLLAMAQDHTRTRWTVAEMLAALRDRALGAMMLLLALPNVLPVPPGSSAILGAPLLLLSAQLMLGRSPWLPRMIAQRSMARETLAGLVMRALPWLRRAERLLRPRWVALASPPVEYAVGFVCVLMAWLLFLPIPLGNMLPALSICVLALGVLARDGLWVLAGAVLAVLSGVLVSGVVYGLAKAALFILHGALG